MSQLIDLLSPSLVVCNVNVASKKRALEVIAKTAVTKLEGGDEQLVFESLLERERLGSTGFGDGVAIPHCRVKQVLSPIVVLLKLSIAIDFDAIDNLPVDILVGLIVPLDATDEHLQLLKGIAELLKDSDVRNSIREAKDSEQIYELILKRSSIEK